jgi:hypothetical protein
MNPEYPASPNPPKVHNPLSTMQPGEQVICEIKRHPIGLFGVYGLVAFLIIVLAVVIFGVAPSVFSSVDRNQVLSVGSVFLLLVAVLGVGFAFISNIVYWGNRWVVTSDSITQVQQTSLFNKQSSQLSLENLEDVTAEQNGILTHMFNYGVIKAETAGERSKFVFMYCPNPTFYAQQILGARERFMQAEWRASGQAPPPQPQAGVNVNTQQ